VLKEKEKKPVEIEEFFITDLVGLMHRDGLKVGCVLAQDENEVMGVDDLPSLMKAQNLYKKSAF
jgi:bifunctional N-acetylglucosamine-1-phosphate-uridyltransferase/glucosamine-1-phosphate-acetyltransferase GlmU-like protein